MCPLLLVIPTSKPVRQYWWLRSMEFPPTRWIKLWDKCPKVRQVTRNHWQRTHLCQIVLSCISICWTRHPPILCSRVFGQGNDGVDPWIKRDLSAETHWSENGRRNQGLVWKHITANGISVSSGFQHIYNSTNLTAGWITPKLHTAEAAMLQCWSLISGFEPHQCHLCQAVQLSYVHCSTTTIGNYLMKLHS